MASPSLGALLGKDFIKALGFVIDFERDKFSSRGLGVQDIPLGELRAGHYFAPLRDRLSEVWRVPPSEIVWLGRGSVVGIGTSNNQTPAGTLKERQALQIDQVTARSHLGSNAVRSSCEENRYNSSDAMPRAGLASNGAAPHRTGGLALAGLALVAGAAPGAQEVAFPMAISGNDGRLPESARWPRGVGTDLGAADRIPEQDGFPRCLLGTY